MIALLAIGGRTLMSAERMTLIGIARSVVVVGLVGWVTILWVWEMESLSLGMRGAIVAVTAAIAEDILFGVLAFGKKFRDDPAGAIDQAMSIWRRKP